MPGPGVPGTHPLQFLAHELAAGTVLERFHQTSRKADAFNPCLGKPSRFSPLYVEGPSGRQCVPTLYAGQNYAAAVFESVFRDLPPKPNPRIIRQGSLIGVGHASLATRRALKLAAFFKQELALLGESRESMIECDASAYAKTVLWAAAIHASPEAFDGIAWASRQYDGAHAYVLFGTRVQKADVEPLGPSTPVDTGPGRDILDAFAQRYEIDIIP